MKPLRWFAAGALLGVLSSASYAFQESKGGVMPSVTPKQGVTTLDIATDGKDLSPAASGPEIRIPGLGKLGVLPKLDFGLELLYGVGEQGAVSAPVAPADRPNDQQDGVQIRGSVKHKF